MKPIKEFFDTGLPPTVDELRKLFPTIPEIDISDGWASLSTEAGGKLISIYFSDNKKMYVFLCKALTREREKMRIFVTEEEFIDAKSLLINFLYCDTRKLHGLHNWNDTFDSIDGNLQKRWDDLRARNGAGTGTGTGFAT